MVGGLLQICEEQIGQRHIARIPVQQPETEPQRLPRVRLAPGPGPDGTRIIPGMAEFAGELDDLRPARGP